MMMNHENFDVAKGFRSVYSYGVGVREEEMNWMRISGKCALMVTVVIETEIWYQLYSDP